VPTHRPLSLGARDGRRILAQDAAKSASSATRYLNKSWAPLHGVPIEQITRQQLKARRNDIVTSFESTVAKKATPD
jgi:hypothetical protein